MHRKSVLERAFEVAADGPASTVDELRATLKAEGYADAVSQTSFPMIRKQLREAMQKRVVGGIDARDRRRLTGVLRLNI